MPSVSFVVPTKNSSRTLRACLNSLRHQLDVVSEIIVVDNASDDGTQAIAQCFADRVLSGGPERSAQRNIGAALADHDVLAFIDSDMVLEPLVGSQAVRQISAGMGRVFVPEVSFGEGYLAHVRSWDRSICSGDPRVEAARFVDRAAFFSVGGFNHELTGPEDWALDDALSLAGVTAGRTTARIWHDEGRINLRNLFHKKRYYSKDLRTYLDTAPHRRGGLVGRYFRKTAVRQIASKPGYLPGLLAIKAVEGTAYALH